MGDYLSGRHRCAERQSHRVIGQDLAIAHHLAIVVPNRHRVGSSIKWSGRHDDYARVYGVYLRPEWSDQIASGMAATASTTRAEATAASMVTMLRNERQRKSHESIP